MIAAAAGASASAAVLFWGDPAPYVEAAHEVGLPYNPDYNTGQSQFGAALFRYTINNNRVRETSYTCFNAHPSPDLTTQTGALVTREPTMNPSPASSRSSRLAAGSMPASATTTMASIPMAGLELPDDRQDRVLLRLAALEAADLEGEPVPVDQQPDHDLRVDPPLLAEPYFA